MRCLRRYVHDTAVHHETGASLTFPMEYMGIFTVYKILTTNYGSACSMLYALLEQVEVSHELGELDRKRQIGGV